MTPAADVTNVGLRAPVVATFNRSFDSGTLNDQDMKLFAGDSPWCSSYNRSQDNLSLSFSCYALPSGTILTAAFTDGIRDMLGNQLQPFTSKFTTMTWDAADNGTIISARPSTGAGGVPPTAPLVLFSNIPLDPLTIGLGIQVAQDNQPITLYSTSLLDNGYTLVFTPNSGSFEPGKLVQWWTTGNLRTTRGTAVNGAYGYFWTAGDTSAVAPAVQTLSPQQGDGTPLNAIFDLRFNVALDPSTVSSGGVDNIYLYDEYYGFRVSVSLSTPEPNVVRLQTAGLNPSRSYRLWVNSNVRSSTGVAASTANWWFGTNGSTTDATTPTIVSAVPYSGATNVGVNVAPGAVFSKPVDPVTVNATTFVIASSGIAQPGYFWFSSDNTRVLFVPYGPLPPGATINLTINGVHDIEGHAVAYASSFQTATGTDFTAPYVVNSSIAENESMPLNSSMTVQFSESMDATTCNPGNIWFYDNNDGRNFYPGLTWSSDQATVYLVPPPLPAGHYLHLYIRSCLDLAGNRVTDFDRNFYTQLTAAVAPPTVVALTPTPGLTNVATNVTMAAQFSAPIDPTTLSGVTLTAAGSPVPFTPVLSQGNTVLQLVPNTPLAPLTPHVFTINGVKDPAGNVVATVSDPFTTASTSASTSPPG